MRVFCIDLEKPEVEIFEILELGSGNCRKWICIICVIEMSGSMLGSMQEVVQQAEMPYLTKIFYNFLAFILALHFLQSLVNRNF